MSPDEIIGTNLQSDPSNSKTEGTLLYQIRLTYTSKYTEVKTMNNLCVTVSIKLCKNCHREIGMY